MPKQIDIGDLVKMRVKFKTLAGAFVDPTTIVLRVKLPSETETVYTYLFSVDVVRESTGIYYVDYLVTESGIYYFKWVGTGAVYAAEESNFVVVSTQF